MSFSTDSPNPLTPLSIGNIVSTALVIYRSRLKKYLQLTATAYLWLLVPIYGWAKYLSILGLMSRLAFKELTNAPESVMEARSHTNKRLWSFLRVAFQISFYLILIYLLLTFALTTIGLVVGFAVSTLVSALGVSAAIITIFAAILIVAAFIVFLYTFIWYFSRWFVAEVSLAVEENTTGAQSINRSWELSKNSVRRVQGVVTIAFLVTLPIVAVTSYIPYIFLLSVEEGTQLFAIVYLIYLVSSLVGGIFLLPFWQTLKAVLYYDLRSRREGLDLEMRK